MKGFSFPVVLGLVTGALLCSFGVVFLVGGPLVTSPLDSMLEGSARGLRTSGEAIGSVTEGVSNSSGMISEVKNSLMTTSEALSSTGDVIQQTVEILEETRIILPAMANDMASMPPMVRNLMPNNHFDEVAERTETVAAKLGLLNAQLEDLSMDVLVTSGSIGEVAVSVETLQEDLLSAEGSFSEAADKMEATACFLERGSFSSVIALLSSAIGVLLILSGLYHIFSALTLRRLVNAKVGS